MAKLKLRTLGCKFAGQSAELDPAGSRPREDCGVDGLPGATILLLANAGEMSGIDGNDFLSMLDNLDLSKN